MKAVPQLITVLFVAVLSAGCVGTANVVFDEREDVSEYQSWSWLVRDSPSVEVSHGNAMAVDTELANLIEHWLLDRGFHRTDGVADFYVTYRLIRRRHQVVLAEKVACRFVILAHNLEYLGQDQYGGLLAAVHADLDALGGGLCGGVVCHASATSMALKPFRT